MCWLNISYCPPWHVAKNLWRRKKILAGGPVSGTIAIVLIIEVETVPELDKLLTSLPAWPQMETEVTPLTTFDGRRQSLLSRFKELQGQARGSETTATGGR